MESHSCNIYITNWNLYINLKVKFRVLMGSIFLFSVCILPGKWKYINNSEDTGCRVLIYNLVRLCCIVMSYYGKSGWTTWDKLYGVLETPYYMQCKDVYPYHMGFIFFTLTIFPFSIDSQSCPGRSRNLHSLLSNTLNLLTCFHLEYNWNAAHLKWPVACEFLVYLTSVKVVKHNQCGFF